MSVIFGLSKILGAFIVFVVGAVFAVESTNTWGREKAWFIVVAILCVAISALNLLSVVI